MVPVNCYVLVNLSQSNSRLEIGFQTSALFLKINNIQNWALIAIYSKKKFLQNQKLLLT
jgi:hypothetical protein